MNGLGCKQFFVGKGTLGRW